MTKYYAVKKGRKPGIYYTWSDAQKQVQGFPGAIFKSFTNLASTKQYLQSTPQQSTGKSQIWLYTDGGTRNTGNYQGGHVKSTDKAAWAYLIKYRQLHVQASAGQYGATNNQMELTAVLKGLQRLITLGYTKQSIILVSDSQYVLNAFTQGWLHIWHQRNWKKADGQPVKNQDLWQQIYLELNKFTHLQFSWTKGHAQNDDNNFVDQLLNQTMDQM